MSCPQSRLSSYAYAHQSQKSQKRAVSTTILREEKSLPLYTASDDCTYSSSDGVKMPQAIDDQGTCKRRRR